MAFPAFLDTCTLFGSYLCDTLLRLAEAEAFRPLWSPDVLDELDRNLRERGLPGDKVAHRIAEMRRVFPESEVQGYEPLIESMTCDEKDRHVLAAAIRARAEVLVTFNVRDFPEDSTRPYDVEVVHTDSFLLDQLDLYPGLVMAALHRQAGSYRRPGTSLPDLLVRLAAAGVPGFAAEARRHLPPSTNR
jgi:predicted nucleic acid-binding protein